MGMGEPLANLRTASPRHRHHQRSLGALGLGARHITVSTSGLAPQIRLNWRTSRLQIRLAISLHGATDEVRDADHAGEPQVPAGRPCWTPAGIITPSKKQKLTFEYILIDGVNDSPELQAPCAGRPLRSNSKPKVNLIPYNTVDGLAWRTSSAVNASRSSRVHAAFAGCGSATLRREKGHDIAAACGQLRRQTLEGTAAASRDLIHAQRRPPDSREAHAPLEFSRVLTEQERQLHRADELEIRFQRAFRRSVSKVSHPAAFAITRITAEPAGL